MTTVEFKNFTFRWDEDERAWIGPGVPDALTEFLNLIQPDPITYYASSDPNPGATRAELLKKQIGAKVLTVAKTESKAGAVY